LRASNAFFSTLEGPFFPVNGHRVADIGRATWPCRHLTQLRHDGTIKISNGASSFDQAKKPGFHDA
jgi:hypothetical protein